MILFPSTKSHTSVTNVPSLHRQTDLTILKGETMGGEHDLMLLSQLKINLSYLSMLSTLQLNRTAINVGQLKNNYHGHIC